jgi:hypothetical protein
VRGHEPLGGDTRGQSSRPAEHGLDREVRLESSCSNGGLQRAHVDVEFLGQLGERQELNLMRPAARSFWVNSLLTRKRALIRHDDLAWSEDEFPGVNYASWS